MEPMEDAWRELAERMIEPTVKDIATLSAFRTVFYLGALTFSSLSSEDQVRAALRELSAFGDTMAAIARKEN